MIDPLLTESLHRLQGRFASDPRCLGMYLWGSLGTGEADAHSDVDAALVVQDDAFDALAAALRRVVEGECGPIVAWLTEGEAPGFCNYAFLYEVEERLLLYDLTLMSRSAFVRRGQAPGHFLFRREGFPDAAAPSAATASTGESLEWLVTNYWIYMYLNGKYLRRGDLFKLLYVQQVLFQTHLKVLRRLYPEADGTWWARDVKHLPPETREELLVYFPRATTDAIRDALGAECVRFSRDAKEACRRGDVGYPAGMEAAVRRHLVAAGVVGTPSN
jgi:predicted nucleotidyltransferase